MWSQGWTLHFYPGYAVTTIQSSPISCKANLSDDIVSLEIFCWVFEEKWIMRVNDRSMGAGAISNPQNS